MDTGRRYARLGGALYVFIFFAAGFGEVFVSGSLIVAGDSAATAQRILGSEELWRLGIGAQSLTLICDVLVAWALFELLKPVGKHLALLAAFFRLTYVAVYSSAVVANMLALRFAQEHVVQDTMFAIRAHDAAFAISLLFFGIHLGVIGYLIGRRPLAAQWLSALLVVTGVCYVMNTFSLIVAPSVHAVLFPWILLPAFFGEIALTLWLLFARRLPAALAED